MQVEKQNSENKESVVEDLVSANEEVVEETPVVEEEATKEEAQVIFDKKLPKDKMAKVLVEEAKTLVSHAEGKMDECKLLLADDLSAYESAKTALKEGGLNECDVLLSALGYHESDEDEIAEEGIVFETKEEVAPLYVKDVSSGKFSSFLLSLIVGAGGVVGTAYYATQQLGLTLDTTKLPSMDVVNKVLGWVGTQIGRPDDVMSGGLALGGASLLLMVLVYKIRVSSKANKNLTFASNQLEEAKRHVSYKEDCKSQMEKIDAHIHDAIDTLKTHQVLFNEQKGKLQRILHIEGEQESYGAYHEKSKDIMEETAKLSKSVRGFMAVPMSEEGKLSGKSTLLLHSAKEKMKKMIDSLY